jgi:hypothetical protein
MANAKNFALNGLTKPLKQRALGLLNNIADGVKLSSTSAGVKPQKPLFGFVQSAYLQVGTKTSAAGFFIQVGDWIVAEKGLFATLTINTGAGALAVTSNGFDITVTLASGGSTAAVVVAAINAAFNASFCVATLNQGSAGGSNVAALTKTNFINDVRYPALP